MKKKKMIIQDKPKDVSASKVDHAYATPPKDVLHWTINVDLFEHELHLVPIHTKAHLSLAINIMTRMLYFYDSLHGDAGNHLNLLKSGLISARSLASFLQFSEVMLGISAIGISAGVALFTFTSHDQIERFYGNHPYVVLATIAISGYYAISQLTSLSTKVKYHLENAKLRNTVMFSFLQSMELHERA
uniref:Ubiquitin-like protease family profile domain-containing protein n=1 Tax=Ditylenchus dipsaci TaxID=166011 RepID=A0A915E371_9BILA